MPAIAIADENTDRNITIQPNFLWIEYKYIDKKNAIAKANDTRPCLESDEIIAVTDITMHTMANTLNVLEKFLINKIENARTEKIAISADAKFGFPTVAITAL